MALNAMKKLSAMRMKPQNPMLRRMQGMSDEMRKKMMEGYEGERARLLAMQREEMYGLEDENLLMAGERRRAELESRQEIGKAIGFLMTKKKLNRSHAYALAVAYSREIASIEKELREAPGIGPAKARAVAVELREELLNVFKNPQMMAQLLKESKSQGKEFSQSILAQVRNEVFQKYGIPTE